MKPLYVKNLTNEEIKSSMDSFFKDGKQGKIVKIIYLLKNEPEYTKSKLQEVYGNINQEFANIKEYLYNLYYPNCIKNCDVCGKRLDWKNIRIGYHKGINHIMCKKDVITRKFSSYHDLIGKIEFRKRCDFKNLSERQDIQQFLKEFRHEHNQFKDYTDHDLVYLLIMNDSIEQLLSSVPVCECGKLCKVEPMLTTLDQLQFSEFCYDEKCKNRCMVKNLETTMLKTTGYRNTSNDPITKKKKSQKILSHYGSWENFMNETIWKWCRENNVTNTSQLEFVKSKKLQNILDLGYSGWKEYLTEILSEWCNKMGVINTSQIDAVKILKETNYFQKTGYRNPFCDPVIIEQIHQYWIDHPEEKQKVLEKVSKTLKESKKNINHFRKGYTGLIEHDVLNEVEQILSIKIYRQVSCMQYFLDGYISDYRIAIEYDEKVGHTKQHETENDILRQKEIMDYAQISFVRIKEDDWLFDKNGCINNIQKCIEINKLLKHQNNLVLECLDDKRYRIRKVVK